VVAEDPVAATRRALDDTFDDEKYPDDRDDDDEVEDLDEEGDGDEADEPHVGERVTFKQTGEAGLVAQKLYLFVSEGGTRWVVRSEDLEPFEADEEIDEDLLDDPMEGDDGDEAELVDDDPGGDGLPEGWERVSGHTYAIYRHRDGWSVYRIHIRPESGGSSPVIQEARRSVTSATPHTSRLPRPPWRPASGRSIGCVPASPDRRFGHYEPWTCMGDRMTTLLLLAALTLTGDRPSEECRLRADLLGSLAPLDPEIAALLEMGPEQVAKFKLQVAAERAKLDGILAGIRFATRKDEMTFIREFWANNARLDALLTDRQKDLLEVP
jgi:hypothetical protein